MNGVVVFVVEVRRFLESDLHGAGSFRFLGVCKSGAGSFWPEPVPADSASPELSDNPNLSKIHQHLAAI